MNNHRDNWRSRVEPVQIRSVFDRSLESASHDNFARLAIAQHNRSPAIVKPTSFFYVRNHDAPPFCCPVSATAAKANGGPSSWRINATIKRQATNRQREGTILTPLGLGAKLKLTDRAIRVQRATLPLWC